jgi:hypothetical protein
MDAAMLPHLCHLRHRTLAMERTRMESEVLHHTSRCGEIVKGTMVDGRQLELPGVKEPNGSRPYRTWAYPVVPVLFIAASAMLLYYSFRADVEYSVAEIAMIVAGVPFYLYFAAKRSAAANCSPVHDETFP